MKLLAMQSIARGQPGNEYLIWICIYRIYFKLSCLYISAYEIPFITSVDPYWQMKLQKLQ